MSATDDQPAVITSRPLADEAWSPTRHRQGVRRLLLGIEITLVSLVLVIAAAGTSGATLGLVLAFVGLAIALAGA